MVVTVILKFAGNIINKTFALIDNFFQKNIEFRFRDEINLIALFVYYLAKANTVLKKVSSKYIIIYSY